jgi:basic membrane lipoprotein Med (substrate-binding protein (PBP1-ABC) superfamily)/DNA-binding SARP family transcriptional activator
VVAYRILGPFEVAVEGRAVALGPPKQRALLAILLLHANEILPVDRLIELLWAGRPPRHAAHAIQVYVSELRRVLEPVAGSDVIAWRSPGYVLTMDPDALDANLVERLVAEGARQAGVGDLGAADALLGRARQLWRGPPLSDFVYEEFAQDDIRHLTDVWLNGTETLAQVKLGLGDPAEGQLLAEAAIRQDPLRERPCELRMRSLYRSGHAAEALRAYEAYRRSLAAELGVEPSPRLGRLHEAILIHDPALGPGDDDRAPGAEAAARNPFKGLRAFGEQDAGDFFGREALIGRVVDTLAAGVRLVTLVGPSGSGKSSVLAAGLVPAVGAGAIPGSDRWAVARMRPGTHPLSALEAACSTPRADGERVLVIDQVEEAFELADGGECGRFLERLTRLVTEDGSRVRALLALRADFYDRPLLHATFARAFLPGVVNVVPMTAGELEAAIVEPARRVGIAVEPALLAELVSETIDRAGGLPLLEHALAELFDRRMGAELRLDEYRSLGGLRGALSRRAEEVFCGLDADGQGAARQVLLRLVRLGESQRSTARRAPLQEVANLAIDPLVLSDLLRRFEANRLITFDRDPITGASTAEVAHEALLSEWPRLAAWIDSGRADLRQHDALAARVGEWAAAGRIPDDLLTGVRLDEYEAWSRETTLALSVDERAFIDASSERRRAERADEAARAARVRRLERGARVRLLGFVAAAALLVAAIAYGLASWPGRAPDVVLVYPGPGANGLYEYESIKRGFDDGVARLGLDAQTVVEQPESLRDRIERLAEQGVRLVVIGYAWSNPEVELVARDHPATQFLASDYIGTLPNVWHPRMAFEEGAFLVGAAAALRTGTGTVGIVVVADSDLDWPMPGGFIAGAGAADEDVKVLVTYLAQPPRYVEPTDVDVREAAQAMYRAGADVVFYTGRAASIGVFEAAERDSTTQGRQLWAIGRETDYYAALPYAALLEHVDAEPLRDHVLTSLITRWDLAISTLLEQYASGAPAENRRFGLAQGAFELTLSGGVLDDIRPQIDALRARVVAGEIEVPEFPPDRGPAR